MQIEPKNLISFKAISLNKEEINRTNNLLWVLDNPAQKEQAKLELFDIFDKHLQNEAKLKTGKIHYQEDFLQRLYLTFLESLENIKFLTTKQLLEILNKTKPNKEEIKEDYRKGTVSINKNCGNDDSRILEEKLHEEKILKPLSIASEEERSDKLKELQNITAETLSVKDQDIISQRAVEKTYKDIAQKDGVSITYISNKIKSAIAKIQLKNNTLPQEYELFIDEFIKNFDLKSDRQEIVKIIVNNIELFNHPIEKLYSNIIKTSQVLDIDNKKFTEAALKQPALFVQKPETISENILKTSQLLDVDSKKYTEAALMQPQLFYQKPETISENILKTSQLLDVDSKKYTEAALTQPQLFSQKPETIFENISKTSQLLDIDRSKYINAALKRSQLFYLKPKTISQNILKTSQLLDINKKKYTEAALKRPSLFYQKPETIFENISKTSQLLDIGREKYINAALKQPQLFYQKPETIFENISKTSKLLDVDSKKFTEAALKQPQLFYQKPETIFENILKTSQLLDIGRKNFTDAALKQPPLFCQKPETILENASKTSQLLDIDRKKYTEAALKKPSMFYQKPEAIAKKANIIKYYKQIQGKNDDKVVFSVSSDAQLYQDIFAYLIKKSDRLKKALHKNELLDYLKSQNKIYNFTIPIHELADDFTKYVQEFSKSNFGKQIFKIVINK